MRQFSGAGCLFLCSAYPAMRQAPSGNSVAPRLWASALLVHRFLLVSQTQFPLLLHMSNPLPACRRGVPSQAVAARCRRAFLCRGEKLPERPRPRFETPPFIFGGIKSQRERLHSSSSCLLFHLPFHRQFMVMRLRNLKYHLFLYITIPPPGGKPPSPAS